MRTLVWLIVRVVVEGFNHQTLTIVSNRLGQVLSDLGDVIAASWLWTKDNKQIRKRAPVFVLSEEELIFKWFKVIEQKLTTFPQGVVKERLLEIITDARYHDQGPTSPLK